MPGNPEPYQVEMPTSSPFVKIGVVGNCCNLSTTGNDKSFRQFGLFL